MQFSDKDLDQIRNSPKSWHDETGRHLAKYMFRSDHDLSSKERHQLIRHYVDGFERLDQDALYIIIRLDFPDDRTFAVTIHCATVDRNRVSFALSVSLRKKFPDMKLTW